MGYTAFQVSVINKHDLSLAKELALDFVACFARERIGDVFLFTRIAVYWIAKL